MGRIGLLLAVQVTSFSESVAHGPATAAVRIDRLNVAGGGELLTLYRQVPNHSEVPVVAVLRDTMGDTTLANNRLRYVWILTDRPPPWYKHVFAALPFLYTRMPAHLPSPNRKPKPVLDLGKPGDRSVAAVAQTLLQSEAFDPLGAMVRASTRSYHLNDEFRKQTRVAEALTALSDLDSNAATGFTSRDMEQLRARLLLSTKTFGGWVGDGGLARVYANEVTNLEEMRGHNWDILRQAAELNGLEFQPLRLAGGPPAHAILWVSKEEAHTNPAGKHFHSRFLKISSPWGDDRVRNWQQYTETHQWSGQPTVMIPLAVYSLDYPKVPHLVADMRDSFAPSRREMFRRAVTDATAGVLGVTRTANLELFAAAYAWEFISSRWGAPNNRAWRVRSYAELRYRLAVDTTLDPALRKELAKRANWLAMNPFEESLDKEVQIARIQHAALVKWVESPGGAPSKLNKDRREELATMRQSGQQRIWANAARVATLGLYRQRAADVPATFVELDERRQIATHKRLLEQIVDSGEKHPEVSWNAEEVQRAVSELERLRPNDPQLTALIQKVSGKLDEAQPKPALVFVDAHN